MKLIIAGSRTFTDYNHLVFSILHYEPDMPGPITEVVTGGAIGADLLGEQWAIESGINCTKFFPKYDEPYTPGKLAPLIRNRQMAEYGDALLALWDGMSGGTANMIANMCLLNKPVFVVKI